MQIPIIEILAPIFGIIILGYILKKQNFPGETFWDPAEKITYYLLFPSLLIHKISNAPLITGGYLKLIGASVSAVLSISLLLLAFRFFMKSNGPSFSSLFQGTVRFNTYIGLTIILQIYGTSGMVTAGIIMAVLIPLVNLLSVSFLIKYGQKSESQSDSWLIISKTARNPIVIACLLGITLNSAGIQLTNSLSLFLQILGQAALPLGLLTVGGSMQFGAMKKTGHYIASASILKLIAMPAVMWMFCILFKVPAKFTAIALIFAALPGSALSFILAKQLGGDSRLMANIVTVQTCLSIVTLPLLLSVITKT